MGRVSFCLKSQLPKWIYFFSGTGSFRGAGSEIEKQRDGGLGVPSRVSPLKELRCAASPGQGKAEA